MGVALISGAVGIYSLTVAALWLIRPAGIDFVAPAPLLPYFHAALVLLSAALLLYGMSEQGKRPVLEKSIRTASLLTISTLGIISVSGYVLNPDATPLFLKVSGTNDYQTLRSLLAPTIALIGLLSLSPIRARALMGGGTVLLIAATFLASQTPSASPVLFGLIGIGFLLEGNRQYQEQAFSY